MMMEQFHHVLDNTYYNSNRTYTHVGDNNNKKQCGGTAVSFDDVIIYIRFNIFQYCRSMMMW